MPIAVLVPSAPPSGVPSTAAPSTLSYKLYDTTNMGTAVATLSQWFDEQSVDVLNDCGHGALKLQNDDTQLASCTRGRVLRKYVDSTAAFQWLINNTVRHSLAPGEEGDELTELSGDGIARYLAQATVKPTLGLDREPWASTRTFSFASPEYVPSGWSTATAIVSKQSAQSTFYTGLPAGWPDPDAVVIGPSGTTDAGAYEGSWYLIADHTFSGATDLVGFNAADNKASLFGNGFMLTTFGTEVGFNETHRVTTRASTGTFRIGAKVSNFRDGGSDPGLGRGDWLAGSPTAFWSSWFPIDGRGKLGPLAIHTDTSWSILEYPAAPPGWTIGGVMNLLLTEAQTAGLLTGVTWDFTATNDSAGNPWSVYETITVNVGQNYLDVLRAFAGVYCDWAMAPDTLNLSMWRLGERSTIRTSAVYTAGSNLTSLTHTGVDTAVDALVVSWSGGPQFRVPPSGGLREAAFSAGDASTRAEAQAQAEQQLALLGGTRIEFAAEIEPVGHDDQPYTGYTVGDVVSVPDETDVASSQRVVQVVGTSDPEGNPVWAPTFRDVFLDVQARLALNTKRFANGGLGGYSTVASPSGSPPDFGSKINTSEVTFSSPDPVAAGTATKDKVPSESGNLFAVAVTAQTPGSSATTFQFNVDGNDVLGGTGSLGSAVQFALFPVSYAGAHTYWVEGNKSRLNPNITAVGTSVAGLLFEPRFL